MWNGGMVGFIRHIWNKNCYPLSKKVDDPLWSSRPIRHSPMMALLPVVPADSVWALQIFLCLDVNKSVKFSWNGEYFKKRHKIAFEHHTPTTNAKRNESYMCYVWCHGALSSISERWACVNIWQVLNPHCIWPRTSIGYLNCTDSRFKIQLQLHSHKHLTSSASRQNGL